MQAAELRHLIEIQRRILASDGSYTWVAFRSVMASVEPLSAREFMSFSQNVNPTQAKIKVWYLDGVDNTMRIRHGAIIYNIEGVLEDNLSGRHWLTIMVSRGTNVG